jgi:hypothetical protein
MFGIGKLLGSVVKVVNAPIRAAEDLVGIDNKNDRLLSQPLDALAKELKKADKDEDDE